MWMFISGMMLGMVIGFCFCALFAAKRRGEDCLNCPGVIERDQILAGRDADIRALGEEIKRLNKANAALRGAYKRAVGETQRIAFLAQKEA